MANEDARYAEWLRRQPCRACGATEGIELHHQTGAGMGLRAHDHAAIPLCAGCHRDFHCLTGRFATWCKTDRQVWQVTQIEALRGTYQPAEEEDAENCF